MATGINTFREYFNGLTDRYILIGGAACEANLERAGLDFRRTKDLDIVLCLDTIDAVFADRFREFIDAGRYTRREKEIQKRQYFRFQKPEQKNFPAMLELFCRAPDAIALSEDVALTPVPVDDASSMSAILMDDDYYDFLQDGRIVIDEISYADPIHLIPLKAIAWLNLQNRKAQGLPVDTLNIIKHKNDIFRLYQLISPETNIQVAERIKEDLLIFIARIANEPINLASLGLINTVPEEVFEALRKSYSLG